MMFQNPTSPTKFSSQATDSPSKVNVPRRERNRVSKTDDIEFAAEITTSLLGQVRHLQAVLAERDEALKSTGADKSRLELEAEGFSQRLRSLDESEQRYKDENWNLETQMQEVNAAAREAAAREKKLQQSLATSTSEKHGAQKELDDLRQDHSKVTEDYALVRKNHESELAGLRKSVNMGENEKGTLQRKIEELTSQNRELATGLAGRFRDSEVEPEADAGAKTDEYPFDLSEREHSPPPSPTKGAQRHSMLESETLKSSLNHAHRMIQNLKGNVHREKSEKQELKRMLQEARDELEIRRAEPNEKRLKSKSITDIRKTGRAGLGQARHGRTDIMVDNPERDPDWEDHDGEGTPRRLIVPGAFGSATPSGTSQLGENSDAYQTANETEDAFETANERDTTDNDAFETGAESMAGDDSDEMTETESGVAREGTVRGRKPSALATAKPGDRRSYQSTASTSEDDEERALHTPIQGQPQRFRLKMNRGSRKSRHGSTNMDNSNPPSTRDSPASIINGGGDVSQSLFNELENLSGDDNDGTPSKGSMNTPGSARSIRGSSISDRRSISSSRKPIGSQPSTPGQRPDTMVYTGEVPPVPRIPTIDSAMMTEPWEPTHNTENEMSGSPSAASALPQSAAASIASRIFGPSTPQSKNVESEPASGSYLGSVSRRSSTSTQPRPVWDQPLQIFSSGIPGLGESADTTPLSTKSVRSQSRGVSQDRSSIVQHSPSTSPVEIPEKSDKRMVYHEPPPVPTPATSTRVSQSLSMSPITSLETAPVRTIQRSPERTVSHASKPASVFEAQPNSNTSGGILGSVFGWNRPKSAIPAPEIAQDETAQENTLIPEGTASTGRGPLHELPANTVNQKALEAEIPISEAKTATVDVSDRGAQTLLSSEQIDNLFTKRYSPPFAETQKSTALKPLSEIGAISPPLNNNRAQEVSDIMRGKAPEQGFRDLPAKSVKRPTSTTSMRSRSQHYPPLPPDHQEAIAAASRTPSVEPGSMGPPLAPASASAYIPRGATARSRQGSRPQTPSQQGYPSPSSKGGTTPRATRYSTTRSAVSRRSSFSSFASELDERFNIRTDGVPIAQGYQAPTDPRMIQAITQTMIGEMMWKYTRKAGRGEMSNSRHRRFFWVHPYTRTLYWSDRDPAQANRAELKSKSVAIEAVRVVTDDNPMPPGLHRKSLIIITPGRSVKFTAQTSQRHETWFNALSYLLLRTNPDGSNAAGDLTDADVDEFNPQSGFNRHTTRSRVSLASFKSNRNQNRQDQSRLSSMAPPAAASAAQSETLRARSLQQNRGSVRSRISRSLSRNRGSNLPEPTDHSHPPTATYAPINTNNESKHGSMASRISGFGGSVRNSMRSRSSMRRDSQNELAEPGVLEGGRSVVSGAGGDSAEDLRRVIEEREKGERNGKLENVRACCDGEYILAFVYSISTMF